MKSRITRFLHRLFTAGTVLAAVAGFGSSALAQPYRGGGWELDHRYRHDHYYPQRGGYVARVPPGAVVVRGHGNPYYFYGGVWYRPAGSRFVIAAPPFGLVVPVLPPAYVTLWFGGAPYYYANSVYYTPAPGGYVVTEAPPGIENAAPPPPPPPGSTPDLIVYPRNGQTPQQTAADRDACAQWATGQSAGQPASVYMRAMSACMDGRGYTVR